MNSPSTMAQAQPSGHTQQQRPSFTQPQYNQSSRDFQAPPGRSNSFGAPSPQMMPNYSSPSPHSFSPNMGQAPPPKRPRLSQDVQSSFSNPSFSPVGTPSGPSPVNGTPTTTTPVPTSRPGLMAPPQRPIEKEDGSYDDILSGTGINIEEEQRNLTRNDFYSQPSVQSSFQNGANSFDSYQTNSFGQTSNASFSGVDGLPSQNTELTLEQITQREHERADWEAARHSQHPLWDMFLFGGTLNDRVKKISQDEHMNDPQTGVLVNTQKTAPAPVVRVNGLEGASKVIDKGQSILDTRDKAERLSDILKLVSLATKTRLTGFLNASARLSLARQEHSTGRIPEEWSTIAAAGNANKDSAGDDADMVNGTSHKRTHSQASLSAGPHPAIAEFDRAVQKARSAEEARLAKRAKRAASSKTQDGKDVESTDSVEQMVANINAETEKKTTKKERKLADAKMNEQQQHKSANEAARMATSGLIGRGFGGKKSKSYAWMTGGGGGGGGGVGGSGGSAASTPVRAAGSSTSTPVTGTPVSSRQPVVPRGRRFVQWDEEKDPGIQARDILSVLESDGKAARSYVKGCSVIDA